MQNGKEVGKGEAGSQGRFLPQQTVAPCPGNNEVVQSGSQMTSFADIPEMGSERDRERKRNQGVCKVIVPNSSK